jgi:putative restriction endonuclease
MDIEEERQIRNAAMADLSRRQAAGQIAVPRNDRFEFHGENIRFMNPQTGIWKPSGMFGALSISTVFTPPQAEKPYDDSEIGDDGFGRYKWRGTDPNHPDNQALRNAMRANMPLIWFLGYERGRYAPVYPVYLVSEEPEEHQFLVAVGADRKSNYVDMIYPDAEIRVEYSMRETKQRLHQAPFRAAVLDAYKCRCAICRFAHANLLDAAHIVADSEGGKPLVRNGLALCKMHHSAFDTGIIGITPDCTVKVKQEVLDETDGPMLLHGIQEFHDHQLMVLPERRSQRPDPAFLEYKYEQFLAAS